MPEKRKMKEIEAIEKTSAYASTRKHSRIKKQGGNAIKVFFGAETIVYQPARDLEH